ncbi:MAG TPA: hypothetical protein PK413_08710, partial [Thermoanaerobaculia bacterium]|nr:hypothetical protein [Thermoanaerobaculia bacterium]
PLEAYRREELERMWQNFFGLDKSYHEARRRFVYKEAPTSSRVAWTRGQGVVTSPVLFGVGPDGEPLSRVSPA